MNFAKFNRHIDICVEHPWKSAYIRKIMQPFMHNIEKIVERTFKILQCLRHNIFMSMLYFRA